MVKECRDFIDSLYPNRREWKDNEIMDVLVYYSTEGYTIKYLNDMVLVFDRNGENVTSFGNYEKFVDHIGGNENPKLKLLEIKNKFNF
jgi:hypothetical protein